MCLQDDNYGTCWEFVAQEGRNTLVRYCCCVICGSTLLPRLMTAAGRSHKRDRDCIRVKVTGLAQKLGQLEAVNRDLQSKYWANLKLLGQPCNFLRSGAFGFRGAWSATPRGPGPVAAGLYPIATFEK